MAMLVDNNEQPIADQRPNRRSKKKSIVWEHFTIQKIDDTSSRAYCNHCNKSFACMSGSRSSGTSHMKRHFEKICPVTGSKNQEKNQVIPYIPPSETDGPTVNSAPPRKRCNSTPGFAFLPFDQDQCSHDIARMIILHDYPLNIAEHPGFIDFVRTLQPQFHTVNMVTIQEECTRVYLRERQRLSNFLGGLSGRVNLSLDLWTSDEGLAYLLLRGYFIDNDWKLQNRILNVVMLPFPDSDDAFAQAVFDSLNYWSLDNKLFTLTFDQSFANEPVKRNLRGLISIKNPLILNGQLLLGNCFARVLGHLAMDALASMEKIIKKVLDCVKYVLKQGHQNKFIELKNQLQNPSSKSLTIDDQTKWNTTYRMLAAASELKEVFSCLDTSYPNYKETPSVEEWKQVETLCKYLKIFFDAANLLIAPTYPTTNLVFHEVCKIQIQLTYDAMSQDTFIRELTKPLQERFSEYWKDCSLVLAIAVVLDPRFKMKLVQFSFPRIYGEDADTQIKVVDESLRELFLDYVVLSLPAPTFGVEDILVDECQEGIKMEMPQEDDHFPAGLVDFDVYLSEMMNGQQMKSELDLYLEEPLLSRIQDFDVLRWWKIHGENYPTLSRMATDILCIPVSTVAPESVFDTVSKKMDSYRSSLRPSMVEALICAKDWLQHGSSEFFISTS